MVHGVNQGGDLFEVVLIVLGPWVPALYELLDHYGYTVRQVSCCHYRRCKPDFGQGQRPLRITTDLDEKAFPTGMYEVGLVAAAGREGEGPIADAEAFFEECFYLVLVLSA